jgi:hypothetical protein
MSIGLRKIHILEPTPFQNIGASFPLRGFVSKKIINKLGDSFDLRLSSEFIDIECKTFIGSTIYLRPTKDFLMRIIWSYEFGQMEGELFQFTVGFLQSSQGLITLKIESIDDKENIYIPLVVKQFEPEGGWSDDILEKHKNIGNTIEKYKKDLKEYNEELAKIRASRKIKDGNDDPQYLWNENVSIASEIFRILEASSESFADYTYTEEDKREKALEEKYKDAIKWRGPLVRGIVSQFNGYELRVYSGDHGNHFHVIHKEKGINARFSFPEMKLINYKNSKNTIGKKEEEKIKELCLKPEIYSKFEKEFNKRA